jgi:Family of unknown function (DUF6283)
MKPPRNVPCGSCPYRRDVPSGVWDASEYEKLPPYDLPTAEQPIGAFLCHQGDGHLCAGWVGCHDMDENLAMRLLLFQEPEAAVAALDYKCPVPLFGSGAEAAEHGLRDVESPPEQTVKVIKRLAKKLDAK